MTLERNYTEIGNKMRFRENLDENELRVVLKIGTDFIMKEFENNSTVTRLMNGKSTEFQEYTPYITLVRLVQRYKDVKDEVWEAKRSNNQLQTDRFSEVKSVQLFDKLKGHFIQNLNLLEEFNNDPVFDDELIDTICCTPGLFNEEKYLDKIGKDISFVRLIASEIVPENPKLPEEKREVKFHLD